MCLYVYCFGYCLFIIFTYYVLFHISYLFIYLIIVVIDIDIDIVSVIVIVNTTNLISQLLTFT